jgi:hypothetical protein
MRFRRLAKNQIERANGKTFWLAVARRLAVRADTCFHRVRPFRLVRSLTTIANSPPPEPRQGRRPHDRPVVALPAVHCPGIRGISYAGRVGEPATWNISAPSRCHMGSLLARQTSPVQFQPGAPAKLGSSVNSSTLQTNAKQMLADAFACGKISQDRKWARAQRLPLPQLRTRARQAPPLPPECGQASSCQKIPLLSGRSPRGGVCRSGRYSP